MRGASALQRVLEEYPDVPLQVLLVWEPVLPTDVAPPPPNVLREVTDPRAIQFWDPGRALSAELMRAARANPGGMLAASSKAFGEIFWDYIAFFPAGVTWASPAPEPTHWYFPVVEHEQDIRAHLQ